MQIDHFSTFPHGGAGTAARRLHERLVERGVQSRFWYWRDQNQQHLDESFVQLQFPQKPRSPLGQWIHHQWDKRRKRFICRQYDRHVAERPGKHELFSIPWALNPTELDLAQTRADVIHLHWISFFVDYPGFFGSLPDTLPIVWSLHDMNPLTGGCHYSDGCSRFTVGCGNCPQVASPRAHDVSWHAFRAKHRALRGKRIHIVTPNDWLRDLARNSSVFPEHTQFHKIRLGLDENAFRPLNTKLARRQLDLPLDAPVIAFGAEDIGNWRKGFHHLTAALAKVKAANPEARCIVFGNGRFDDSLQSLPPIQHLGYLSSDEQLRALYSAADVFVLPSREDNQPQTGLESMACGTPVVAFQAGGIPEYVRHGKTGLVSRTGDEDAMAAQILQVLANRELREQLSRQGRAMIEAHHTADHQADAYGDLYAGLVETEQQRTTGQAVATRRAA